MGKKKIVRLTTAGESLDDLLVGQLKYLNQHFDVIAVAKDDGRLQKVRGREGVRVVNAPIERPISLWKDLVSLVWLFFFFQKEKPWCRVPHRI